MHAECRRSGGGNGHGKEREDETAVTCDPKWEGREIHEKKFWWIASFNVVQSVFRQERCSGQCRHCSGKCKGGRLTITVL